MSHQDDANLKIIISRIPEKRIKARFIQSLDPEK